MKRLRKKERRRLGKRLLSVLLVMTLMLGLIPQSAYAQSIEQSVSVEKSYAADGCIITYQEVSTWGNYVNADITIHNESDCAKSLWQICMTYEGTIDNIWNADILSAEEGTYVIAAKTYNTNIEPGQSVSFGFMAYGKEGKPGVPSGISFVEENKGSTEAGKTEEEGGESETIPGQSYAIPEQWKGLNYALFTSGKEALSLYTGETNITGSVHTNQDFYYQGNTLKIDGVLESAKGITLKTADSSESLKVASKQEKAESIDMPDITKEVSCYVQENGKSYSQTTEFNQDHVVVEEPLWIDGTAVFHATTLLGKGIVYAKDSIIYNIGEMATPQDSRTLFVAENGNITLNGSDIQLNAVLYAPKGCVTINANHFTLNGRIIAKQVCINGTTININAGPYDYDMLDFLFKPEVGLKVSGNQKENRKITLDVEEISNTEYIVKEDTVWSITKDGEPAEEEYAIDEENSSAFHKEMLFREAGTYQVAVTVTTGKVAYTVMKELVVEEDFAPTAGFVLESTIYQRNKEGNAVIPLTDTSVSPDGDNIGQRIWTIYYDEDNNGIFTEAEGTILNDGNETKLEFTTEKVGKYKVELQVVETFEDTIPKLLDANAYLNDDTTEYADKDSVVEVDNEAPQAKLDIEKSKSADIVFTVGDVGADTLNAYNAKAKELKQILAEQSVDARIETVATSTFTAQDTFAWKEYSHYNCDGYENHIVYEEQNIKMLGYYRSGMKDFLYVADEHPGQKTFAFDLQRDRTDWHSMEGGGFLFNTTVDEEADTIKGFCILVTQSGLKLVEINCNQLKRFRDGSYNWVQQAGKLLRTFSISNLYDPHHFKIVVDAKTISVWDGDNLVIDQFVLPENDYGYGYGPIISHDSHSCRQRSYFTFANITMQTMTGSSLSDIVEGYEWRPGAAHYVVNLSDAEVPELSSNEETADFAAALIQNDAAFIGIGNDSNENQYHTLLNASQTGGMYLSSASMAETMNQVNGYITASILAKDYTIADYITTDDIVTYKGYYQDAEKDPVYEQQWEYEYDPSIFNGQAGEAEHIVRQENEPITVFEQTGAYAIRLAVRDNPVGENDALDVYRKWSGTTEYEKLLVVQTRPIAEVSVEVSASADNKAECIANMVCTAQDADHLEDSRKGIREEYFWYKNVTDTEWTEGKLPNRLSVGETYLVKYQVTDMEGSFSFPATAVVKTGELRQYEEIVDVMPPEVCIDMVKQEIEVGEEIRIDGYAMDDYGVDTFFMEIDGEQVLDSFGRVYYTGQKEGIVTIKATATDIGGNTATKELQIKVVDNRDKTAPTAVITAPSEGAEIGFKVQIRGTAKDETAFGKYTLSYKKREETEYHVFEESDEPVSENILGTLDITEFKDGTYDILLQVEDAAGNVSYYGISLYIETGVTRGYALTGGISDIVLREDGSCLDIYGFVSAEGQMKAYTLTGQQEGKEEFSIATGTEEMKEGSLLGSLSTKELESGIYNLTLTVEDMKGNTGSACAAVEYTKGSSEVDMDLHAPDAEITGLKLSDDHSMIDIRGTVKDDRELEGYTLSYATEDSEDYVLLVSGSEPIEDAMLTGIATETLKDGTYQLKLVAWDTYGNSTTYTISFTYKKGKENIETGSNSEIEEPRKKEFGIALSHGAAALGTEVSVQVTLPDNMKEDTLVISKGKEELAKGKRKTSFTSEKAGKVTIVAVGVTDEGETLTVEASCTFYNLLDKTPPTVSITSPTIDQVLTEPVDIVGSAFDEEELDFWKLEYRMKGDGDYQLLAEGTEPVKDAVLGQLDTTLLLNGQYEVKLTAQDKGGNIRRLENDYVVEGELKVGNMHIGFNDITAAMGGTTVSVNRTYDSRNKQKGDFGIGWTLDMQGMELMESASIAEGYRREQVGSLFSTGYQMVETVSHDVVVTYGDGSSDRFELTFTPARQALVPIAETKLGYHCVTNQKVKLEILEDTSAYVSEGGLMFYDEAMYESLHYKLTTEEGLEIYLQKEKGVYQIVDQNDHIITVDRDGYHAENGKSITFTRDKEDRIIRAEDPAGNATTYTYDEQGDLVSVTDSADRTVTFTYDHRHNLVSITDPMGIAVARNEYDDDGRLIATIDADGNRTEYNYDVEGRTQTVKDRRGNTTVYTYDDRGNILQTVDAYGNKTTNTYDDANNLLSTKDANGNVTSYAYDTNGNVTLVTAADGTKAEATYTEENYVAGIQILDKTVMAMEYDRKGRIASIEDANGNATTYCYNQDGKLTGLTDEIGEYQKVTYDAEGNVATTTNGAGERASYTYDKDGRCTSVTISREENGESVTFTSYYTYNAAGDIVQSVDNAGNVTVYEYDANGNQTASVDAKGRRITYDYDDLGNMVKTTYPDGTSEIFTYDANGNNVTATDRNGLKVTMTYDKLNRMTKKTYADGTEETYRYDAVGNVIEQVSTSGAKTAYTYDSRNRNTAITDAYGAVTHFAYDESARLTQVTDAEGNEIRYDYDANGNRTKTTYADGTCVISEYDARNRVICQEDQNGNETCYTYDGADRLTKVTDAYGNSYAYGYDDNGNLVTVTDANEQVTCYTYDEVGRVQTVKNALGRTMEYTYDETGKVTEYQDYAGNVTTYVYDDMDRMVKKTAGKKTTKFAYDKTGRLVKVTDESGEVTYTYDSYSRLSSVTDARGVTLTYTYDEAGRLETLDNGFGTTTYVYDLLDRVTRVIDHNGQATVYEYDILGNRSAVRYPNGNVMMYTYDACQRLKEEWITNADGVTLAKYTYTLGKAGERLSVTEVNGSVETEITYRYDRLNRLVNEKIERDGNRLIYEYTYDAVSNRTAKETTVKGDIAVLADVGTEEIKITEGKTTYTYNALNQLVTETSPEGNIIYTYDDNGNLVKQSGEKTVEYRYDQENRLLRATIQKGNSVTVESYTYDYAGNRTAKTVNETDTTYYVNDTSGSLSQVVAETNEKGKATAYYTRGDELISMEKGSEVCYYLYDGHGSVRTLTNAAGRVTDRYSYDAYGNLLEKEGDTENEFLYTGEQYNANTGLYYLRARYMNPLTGTFISMDSYQGTVYDPVSLHKYLYANANPVTYTDPSGDFSMADCSIATSIQSTLNSIPQLLNLTKIIRWANAMCTVYDVAMEIRYTILGGGTVEDVILAMLKGVVVGFMVDGMCKTSLGIILKPMMTLFGLGQQVDQIQEAIEAEDPVEITVRFVQLVCMLFGLTRQCFTGDTLVSTETGWKPIEEMEVGDYVWSENTENGEKELKKVLAVSVSESDTLVHVITKNGTKIDTTENHPFYVEGRGWCAAAELKTGDHLHTKSGKTETVITIEMEKLEKSVKVYNLEIEDNHTYYVSVDEVLVHNTCKSVGGSSSQESGSSSTTSKRIYKPSPKHDPTSGWGSPNPIPDIETGQKLLDTAYSSSKNKQLYNIYDNQLIKFQPDRVEGWHSYLVDNPAKEVPADVLRKMLNDNLITKVQYKDFLKNKR